MTPHGKLIKEVCGYLEQHNALIFACVASHYQSGWPDRYIAHSRWSGWLEFKVGKDTLRTNQKMIIRKLRERNIPAFVIRPGLELLSEDGLVLARCPLSGLLDSLVDISNTG